MATMRCNGFGFALAGIVVLLLFHPGIALSAAAADESVWCAEHRQSLASRRAVLAAEEPELKAGMVAVFTRLESQVGAVADRAPALMERVVDLKGSAGDLSNWWKFSNLFHDAGQQLQSFGKGITAWDIDIVDSLGARITRHESLAYGAHLDEPLYRASCTDPPRGASAKAIAEAMKAEGIKEPEILLYIDLMTEFRTSSVWSLAAIQEKVSSDPDWFDYGPLFVCFLKGQSPDCVIGTGAPATLNLTDDTKPYDLYEARVVQARTERIRGCSSRPAPNQAGMATAASTQPSTLTTRPPTASTPFSTMSPVATGIRRPVSSKAARYRATSSSTIRPMMRRTPTGSRYIDSRATAGTHRS
jgi:hypothetical protein